MNKAVKFIPVLLVSLLFASCSLSTSETSSSNSESNSNSEVITSNDSSKNNTSESSSKDSSKNETSSTTSTSTKVDGYKKLEKSRFTYQDLGHSLGAPNTPSTGDVTIIVVPVNFSDVKVYDFNNQTAMNRLKAVFEGNKDDNTNDYYESLKSFYYKSSYGKLNLNFDFADVFVPNLTKSQFVKYEDTSRYNDGEGTYRLIQEFYKSGKINGSKIDFSSKKYDSDNDGYVDGIWFIYNDNRSSTQDDYWPYTYWYFNNDDINISAYANCSVYFTFEGSSNGDDGHTLFHETGHMLGLDDYYNADNTSSMSAIGGLDMMDYNIGEHDCFSKMALGWTNPYVVSDNSKITLKPFESSGEFIMIPASSYTESAFSEFIAIEFYTPTGLNKFDAFNRYVNRDYYFSVPGVRIFHVDARLGKIKQGNYNNTFTKTYIDNNATSLDLNSDTMWYDVVSSNTPSYSYNGYDLIQTITKTNVSTKGKSAATNSSLFKQGDVMDPSVYTSFFTSSKMHDGTKFEYKIEIETLNDNECVINLTK